MPPLSLGFFYNEDLNGGAKGDFLAYLNIIKDLNNDFLDAFLNYPNWDIIKQQLLGPSNDYLKEICKIADNNALAWNEHKCYGKNGSSFPFNNHVFRTQYREIN